MSDELVDEVIGKLVDHFSGLDDSWEADDCFGSYATVKVVGTQMLVQHESKPEQAVVIRVAPAGPDSFVPFLAPVDLSVEVVCAIEAWHDAMRERTLSSGLLTTGERLALAHTILEHIRGGRA